jgi:AbrB family looped-hinge helix DNA binding protein
LEIGVSSVTSKGQVTIPKDIREALDVSEGDKVIFQADGDTVTLRKVQKDKLSEILMRAKPLGESSLAFQRRLRREWDRE